MIRIAFEEEWDHLVSSQVKRVFFYIEGPGLFHSSRRHITWLCVWLGRNEFVCIFIDGLDEFEGGHERLVTIFKRISNLPKSGFVFPVALGLYLRSF